MKISSTHPILWMGFLAFLSASCACAGDIYKWVDANGKTHYSQTKGEMGQGTVVDVKVTSPPSSATSSQNWQEQERLFNERQAQRQQQEAQAQRQAKTATQPSLSGGKEDGSDKSRCNLARDVLSGAVRHTNGAKTDDNDRKTAESDIRLFCR